MASMQQVIVGSLDHWGFQTTSKLDALTLGFEDVMQGRMQLVLTPSLAAVTAGPAAAMSAVPIEPPTSPRPATHPDSFGPAPSQLGGQGPCIHEF